MKRRGQAGKQRADCLSRLTLRGWICVRCCRHRGELSVEAWRTQGRKRYLPGVASLIGPSTIRLNLVSPRRPDGRFPLCMTRAGSMWENVQRCSIRSGRKSAGVVLRREKIVLDVRSSQWRSQSPAIYTIPGWQYQPTSLHHQRSISSSIARRPIWNHIRLLKRYH